MPQLQKFTGIGTGVIIGAAFATIVGVSAHGGDASTIHACVDHAGNLKVVGPSEPCKQNETALDWSVQGAKGDKGDPGQPGAKGDPGAMGPPGTFTGEFTSPNQAYRLSVTDTGIEMAGPTALIRLTDDGVHIASALSVRIDGTSAVEMKSAAIVDIESSAAVNVKSGIITLEGMVVTVP